MSVVNWLAVVMIGAGCGFLGGVLGKGGSAIATPLLAAAGVPALVAVAAPLPATIPGTLVAGTAYSRAGFIDWRTIRLCLATALPATVAGAIATRWIDGTALVLITDAVVVAIGLRLATGTSTPEDGDVLAPSARRIAVIGAVVGVTAGLLANSGGFLLAPLFITVLGMPVKRALGTSLAAACVLAVPATVVHTGLGHIDWAVVAVFGAASVPLSFTGARVAVRTDPARLERVAGVVLSTLAGVLLIHELA